MEIAAALLTMVMHAVPEGTKLRLEPPREETVPFGESSPKRVRGEIASGPKTRASLVFFLKRICSAILPHRVCQGEI